MHISYIAIVWHDVFIMDQQDGPGFSGLYLKEELAWLQGKAVNVYILLTFPGATQFILLC